MTTQEEAFDKNVSFFHPVLLTVMVQLNEACDERHARQRRPSPLLPLLSLPGAQCNGQSTAHTKEELAYSLAQNRSLNCSCIESMFSTHPLLSLSLSLSGYIYSFHWPRHQLLKKCFAFYLCVILSRFTSFLLQSFSLHQTAIVWARGENTEGEGWGLGMCLACCTIATRLSVSNDALIISTLELGCCIEWQYHPDAMYIAVVSLLACQSFFISLCLRCSSLLSFLHQHFCLLLLHSHPCTVFWDFFFVQLSFVSCFVSSVTFIVAVCIPPLLAISSVYPFPHLPFV